MKKNFIIILVLLFLTVFISGCMGFLTTPGDDSIAPGKGKLEIYLTDSSEKYKVNDPETYSEVNITISEIKVHLAGDDEGEWIKWPLDEETKYNLIELENMSVLLSEGQLESGKYTQIRLFITNSNIFLIGGEEYITLIIPSVYQTGIKLIHPFEIVEGEITKLIIDFDAEKSVVKTDNGEYKLKPVIKVASETYSEGELPTGLVFGTVSYYDSLSPELIGIDGASVSLSGGEYIFVNTTTTSGEAGSEGIFTLDNVPIGNYILNVNANDFDDYSEGIEVISDSDTEVNVVFLFEEPGTISGIVLEDSETGPGPPISGATVSVSLSGGVYIFNSSALTDEDGLFFIDQLPVGTYTLTASAEGYIDYTEDGIVVTKDAITDIDIELIPDI